MQACVSEGIATLEKATHLVNQLSLFSSNEAVEEVSTTDLKWVCECVFVRVGGWGRGYILIRMYVHVHYFTISLCKHIFSDSFSFQPC